MNQNQIKVLRNALPVEARLPSLSEALSAREAFERGLYGGGGFAGISAGGAKASSSLIWRRSICATVGERKIERMGEVRWCGFEVNAVKDSAPVFFLERGDLHSAKDGVLLLTSSSSYAAYAGAGVGAVGLKADMREAADMIFPLADWRQKDSAAASADCHESLAARKMDVGDLLRNLRPPPPFFRTFGDARLDRWGAIVRTAGKCGIEDDARSGERWAVYLNGALVAVMMERGLGDEKRERNRAYGGECEELVFCGVGGGGIQTGHYGVYSRRQWPKLVRWICLDEVYIERMRRLSIESQHSGMRKFAGRMTAYSDGASRLADIKRLGDAFPSLDWRAAA